MQENNPIFLAEIQNEALQPDFQSYKERNLPPSAVVQLAISLLSIGTTFTVNEVLMLINGTYRYGATDLIASVSGVRGNLRKMSCLSRSEKGVKPMTYTREASQKKLCLNCSQNRHLSNGCLIAEPTIKDYYFPEETK